LDPILGFLSLSDTAGWLDSMKDTWAGNWDYWDLGSLADTAWACPDTSAVMTSCKPRFFAVAFGNSSPQGELAGCDDSVLH